MKYGNVLTESSSKPLKHPSVPKKPDKIIGITNSHPEGAAQGISGLCSHSECSGSLSSDSSEHSQGLIAFPQHFLAISLHLFSEGVCKAQQVPNEQGRYYLSASTLLLCSIHQDIITHLSRWSPRMPLRVTVNIHRDYRNKITILTAEVPLGPGVIVSLSFWTLLSCNILIYCYQSRVAAPWRNTYLYLFVYII